jgi:hypothetical protein
MIAEHLVDTPLISAADGHSVDRAVSPGRSSLRPGMPS